MDFKQNTIQEILDSEREMFLLGEKRYGDYFINASEFNSLLNDFIKSVDKPDRAIFVLFYSQVKKHHTLALLSAIRLHNVQCGMDLRQTIEASQWATYALEHTRKNEFVDEDKNGILIPRDKYKKAMYRWLDVNFKVRADEFKKLKSLISSSVGHASIIYAFQNFKMGPVENPGFSLPFFDIEDDFRVKADLWSVANVARGLLDLFFRANQKYEVFQVVDGFEEVFGQLSKKNDELKAEIMANEHFKEVSRLKPDGSE